MFAATIDVLAETGMEGLTIAAVAARSGVHETSIYRRWGNRHQLVLEAMIDHSAELLQVLDTGTIHGDLTGLGQQLVDYGTSPLGQALMRTMASNPDDTDAAAARSAFWAARLGECEGLVDRAKRRGEINPDTDSRHLLELFIAPIHFRLLMTREPVTQTFLDTLAAAAIASAT